MFCRIYTTEIRRKYFVTTCRPVSSHGTFPHAHLHGVSPFEFDDDTYQIMDVFWHRRRVKKIIHLILLFLSDNNKTVSHVIQS
jgi:hypothetical protein